jgi:hypothetical protein
MVLVFEELLLSPFLKIRTMRVCIHWFREAKLKRFERGGQGHVLQYLGFMLENFRCPWISLLLVI